MRRAETLETTASALRGAGCVAAEEEAVALFDLAGGDVYELRELVARRCSGEPLAWITGSVRFCGETVLVNAGVYVPRWQSEHLASAALSRLPERGIAVDLCTGAGPIALVLARRKPTARVMATEIDPLAAQCARDNGVEVFEGDMGSSLPSFLCGRVDVVTGVVPYVPTSELRLLPRDVLEYEPLRALDGGEDGTTFLVRAAVDATALLRSGGSLLLELGGDQRSAFEPCLAELGYRDVETLVDEDGDERGIVCRR